MIKAEEIRLLLEGKQIDARTPALRMACCSSFNRASCDDSPRRELRLRQLRLL